MKINETLKRKFLKDFQVPYSITEEPYFTNAIVTLDYIEEFKIFNDYISNFNNTDELYKYSDNLVGSKKEIGSIMTHLQAQPNYTTVFNNKDFYEGFELRLKNTNVNKISNLYSNNNVGKTFISIDMKEANYQVFNMFGVVKEKTYKEFIKSFTNYEYFHKSKQIRQIIFGQLNSKRQQIYQHYIMSKLYKVLTQYLDDNYEVYYHTSDELLIELKQDNLSNAYVGVINKIEQLIVNNDELNKIEFKVSVFDLSVLKTESGFYHYKEFTQKPNKPKGVSKSEYLEVYKLVNNLPVIESDLYTVINTGKTKRIAKLEPLKVITNLVV